MRKSMKRLSTILLAASMLLGTTFQAYASNVGPGFELQSNPDGSQSTAPEETAGTAETTETTETEVSAEDEAARLAAEEAARIAAEQAAIARANLPQLQTTVLLPDGTWSQPFQNDNWVTVNGISTGFCSISIFLTQAVGNIEYRAYTSNYGWTNWAMNGQQTTLAPDWSQIEAVQLRLTGAVSKSFNLYYTTSVTDSGELEWSYNGRTAGTMGTGKLLTGFRMALWAVGEQFPYSTDAPLMSAHPDGVQTIDGALRYITGTGQNYTGWGWLDGNRYYFADSNPVTGWQYIDGYKYYFDESGVLVQDLEPIIGAAGPYHIRINKEMNCITVYVQDGANGFIIPLKTFLTSTGDDTPLGDFKIPEKYRWRLMNSGVYCQYATRLGAGLPFLMHSLIYEVPNNMTLRPETYNQLGVARSAGCIRLKASDAKWIFDHCPVGTTVTVYNSPVAGPYDRPFIEAAIPATQTWDPTDVTVGM